jgi:hypothetical protein
MELYVQLGPQQPTCRLDWPYTRMGRMRLAWVIPPRLLNSQASGTRPTDPKRALGCRGQEGLPGPGSRLADRMGGMGREAKQARAPSRVAWVVRLNRPEPHRGPWQNFTLELFRSCKLHIFLCKILIIDIFVV